MFLAFFYKILGWPGLGCFSAIQCSYRHFHRWEFWLMFFFSTECVPSIKLCINEKYHKPVLRLHLLLGTILRVISGTSQVNIEDFDNICKEASMLIATDFKWVQINYILHGVFHHSSQLIWLNDGYSLRSLSEEGLEAANKHICVYLETHARKTANHD